MDQEFTQEQIAGMMAQLGQRRYVVRPADGGYVVADADHQMRQMSGVLGLDQAKGWAYGEHESWARRVLRRRGGKPYPSRCKSILNHPAHDDCAGLSYETSDLVDDA